MKKNNLTALEDEVWRAKGILSCARSISTSEAMSMLSKLRLGVAMGMIEGISYDDLNALLTDIRPGVLAEKENLTATSQRDVVRANMIRSIVK